MVFTYNSENKYVYFFRKYLSLSVCVCFFFTMSVLGLVHNVTGWIHIALQTHQNRSLFKCTAMHHNTVCADMQHIVNQAFNKYCVLFSLCVIVSVILSWLQ